MENKNMNAILAYLIKIKKKGLIKKERNEKREF